MTRHSRAPAHLLYRLLPSALLAAALLSGPASAQGAGGSPGLSSPPGPSRVTSLHQWLVDWMISVSPPGITYVKDASETPEEGRKRYEEIADDLISVVYDESEPPLFGGPRGRAMTAAVLAAVAFKESSFRKDVDLNLGPLARGDAGQSWCLAQINLGLPKDGRTTLRVVFEGKTYRLIQDKRALVGWGGEDLVRDRKKCFRTSLRMARMSFGVCKKQDVLHRLANYASGDGACVRGRDSSADRMRAAMRWLARRRPPLTDEEAMSLLRAGPPADLPVPPGSSVSASLRTVPEGIVPS